jgi:ribulose-5-phosphate 4-epimerase/fuculose-1-phosphate aldolase
MIVHGNVAYHDFEGIATDLDERPRLVSDLGDKPAMLLRNHGTLTCGPSVPAAFLTMYFLERACAMQVATLAGGAKPYWPKDDVADKVTQQAEQGRGRIEAIVWQPLLRKLDRLDPSFRN